MEWFSMPVLFSLLGVAFIIAMAGYLFWFFRNKIAEENKAQSNKG